MGVIIVLIIFFIAAPFFVYFLTRNPSSGGGGGPSPSPSPSPSPGSQPNRRCGLRIVTSPNENFPLITGGSNAWPGKWPWMAWLGNCGGTIISPTWILTAGHCVDINSTKSVALGVFNRSANENQRQVVGVKRIIIHPQYMRQTLKNDVALIELVSPVTYDQYKQPICLPALNQDIGGRQLFAAGWGNTQGDRLPGSGSQILKDIELRETNPCRNFNIDPRIQFCANSANNNGICFGDSGGPVMLLQGSNWVQVGVNSFATDPCTNGPGGFARVSAFVEWIKQTAGI